MGPLLSSGLILCIDLTSWATVRCAAGLGTWTQPAQSLNHLRTAAAIHRMMRALGGHAMIKRVSIPAIVIPLFMGAIPAHAQWQLPAAHFRNSRTGNGRL